DVVAPDHPVIVTRTCGHIASVNGRALALAGITDATPDPPGGRYDREGGKHLGVAYETAQTPLQVAALPSREDFRAALLRADEAYIKAGGTSVHDAGGLVGPAFVPAQELAAAGRLHLRIYAFATVDSRQPPAEGLRHRIEHCGICPPDLRARVKSQRILPIMQPAFFWEFGDGYIANYGQHRADTMFPTRSLLAAGVPVVGSSDAPVTHYAPLFG